MNKAYFSFYTIDFIITDKKTYGIELPSKTKALTIQMTLEVMVAQ